MQKKKNLSVNQEVLKLIETALKKEEEKGVRERGEMEVYARIRLRREDMYKKYGKFDDSTKLIREDRERL